MCKDCLRKVWRCPHVKKDFVFRLIVSGKGCPYEVHKEDLLIYKLAELINKDSAR